MAKVVCTGEQIQEIELGTIIKSIHSGNTGIVYQIERDYSDMTGKKHFYHILWFGINPHQSKVARNAIKIFNDKVVIQNS